MLVERVASKKSMSSLYVPRQAEARGISSPALAQAPGQIGIVQHFGDSFGETISAALGHDDASLLMHDDLR